MASMSNAQLEKIIRDSISDATATNRRRRKMEFSKKLVIWAAIIATFSALVPFILSFFDKQPSENISSVVFTACIGVLISYHGKSAFEKHSRNKHNLDENGNPLQGSDENGG
jgi:Co/Zn/Cd efflux system component